MDSKMLARLGAVVFVAVAITAAVVEMTRKDEAPAGAPARIVEPARDPPWTLVAGVADTCLSAQGVVCASCREVCPASAIRVPPGQRRCQQLGQQAASDAECLRVWAETRNRFLGRPIAPASPSSSDRR